MFASLTESVDVRMIDLRSEENLWRNEWVLLRQEELESEETTLVRRVSGAGNLHKEVSGVGL